MAVSSGRITDAGVAYPEQSSYLLDSTFDVRCQVQRVETFLSRQNYWKMSCLQSVSIDKYAKALPYPGFAILAGCLVPFRRGLGAVGVGGSSVAIFGLFAR